VLTCQAFLGGGENFVRAASRLIFAATTVTLFTGLCFSQSSITVSPRTGPPTTETDVSGSGFSPDAEIHLYFDNTYEASTVANSSGSFSNVAIEIPASATPGEHRVRAETSAEGGAQTPFQVNTNWAMFGFQPAGGRWNPYENQLGTGNANELRLDWSYTTGAYVVSSPAVANGVVYVGSDDGNVYALDAKTGANLWSFATGGGASSPAVVDGVVYVGSDDDNLYALDAATGNELWSFATGSYVESSPAVANGIVYVGSDDDNVYAIDAKTGAKRWTFTTGDPVSNSPAVADGVVYIGSLDRNVYALNAATGNKLWSFSPASADGYPDTAAVANGVVYVGFTGCTSLYALNSSTGAEIWNISIGCYEVLSAPAVADGVVYVDGWFDDIYAVNASTGTLLWTFDAGAVTFGNSPAVANGVLYAGDELSVIYAVNATTGGELWSYNVGCCSYFSSAVVANGMVYVGSSNDNIYAFSLPAGEKKK
jgi:outer membrane protein assembly factor BamB